MKQENVKLYTFETPTSSYLIKVTDFGERSSPYLDRYEAIATDMIEHEDWNSDHDLRGCVGVLVMRIIRKECEAAGIPTR